MPVTTFDFKEKYRYQVGFDSHLEYVYNLTFQSPVFALPLVPVSSPRNLSPGIC